MARTGGVMALAAGLGVLAAGCAGQIPLAASGLLSLAAGALIIHHDRLRLRIEAHSGQLEQSNQQLRAEIGVRKAAEGALEASEKRLHAILATLPMPVIVKDAESRIQLMNHAVEEKWGVLFKQVIGTTGCDWVPPAYLQSVLADDRAVFAAREVVVKESQVWNHVNGRPVAFESYKKPVFGADGEPHSLICVYVDITQRKHAEDALQRSFLQLRGLTAELEMLKEEDRRRIAQGIHDDLGQNLLALKIDVEMLHARASERHPRLKRRVGHVLDTIDATIRSARAIMNDLHPSTLELGLPVALEWLVGQFEHRSGIRCTLRVVGDREPLPDARRTSVIFRMVQEALLHVLGHARASRIDVTLALGAQRLSITISDDGGGIGCGEEAELRLRAVRERVDVFGGELGIECVEAGGTRLSILIPTETGATAE
ncbi:PAS domain-containing protein [Massilia sp. RP-1-19]|uniref:PAS domain-containing protein n=1 Tax=Massilia polaris TaxID=2728846 RepID=A0A848HKS0_9BURK|nr:PAS domain-containing protein [Massilia polaris]NML61752.1 PAS domain-containing protein [Massilia polaris]